MGESEPSAELTVIKRLTLFRAADTVTTGASVTSCTRNSSVKLGKCVVNWKTS